MSGLGNSGASMHPFRMTPPSTPDAFLMIPETPLLGVDPEFTDYSILSSSGSLRSSRRNRPPSPTTLASASDSAPPPGTRVRILILYTGGTIGMREGPSGYEPAKGYLSSKLRTLPQFTSEFDPTTGLHLSPATKNGFRAIYFVKEYSPLLDSACMTPSNWNEIGRSIAKHFHEFDSFIVLHGTDTMAYTASALSFMLEGLSKLVVLTGSQIPLSEHRNDAYDNLLGALFVASEFSTIPEVAVFFDQYLFRGNRSTKINATGLDAFGSLNLRPLLQLAVDVEVDWSLILPRPVDVEDGFSLFEVREDLNVVIVFMYPGIRANEVQCMLSRADGAVLMTFGAGNINVHDAQLLEVLESAKERGIPMVNVTQCRRGRVVGAVYASGNLKDIGVIPGLDTTTEAAFTKLIYLLSKTKKPQKERARLMQLSIRGELTPPVKHRPEGDYSLRCREFVDAVARVLDAEDCGPPTPTPASVSSSIQHALYPALLNSLAASGDKERLSELLETSEFCQVNSVLDYDRRSPLHLAASNGHLDLVKYLVDERGHNMNLVDALGFMPLDCAISVGAEEVVAYLAGEKGARTNKFPRPGQVSSEEQMGEIEEEG